MLDINSEQSTRRYVLSFLYEVYVDVILSKIEGLKAYFFMIYWVCVWCGVGGRISISYGAGGGGIYFGR